MKEYNDMTLKELKNALADVISERERHPKNAVLDEKYLKLNALINRLASLLDTIRMYVMNDTVKKENFTDIEICCEADNDEANEELENILDEYTWNKCKKFFEINVDLKKEYEKETKINKKANARYWDEIDNTIEKALKKIKGMSLTPTVDTDFYGDGILPELREKIIAYFKDKGGDYPYVNEDM